MQKSTLGKTGIEVSEICFGTLTVGPVQTNMSITNGGDVLAYGIEKGINFFDTAQLYKTYEYIRYAMEKTKKFDIIVSSKTYAYEAQQAHQAVEEARKLLNRDYIDIFMLHEQESIHTLRGHMPALEVLMNYKSKGIIKAVGLSTHHVAGVKGAVEMNLDVVHPLIKLRGLGIVDGTKQEMEEQIKIAHKKGIGIYLMKVLAGGNLFKYANESLMYARDFLYKDSIAIGMQSFDEIDANLEFFEKGCFSKDNIEKLSQKTRKLHVDDWCVGCGECEKRCQQKAIRIDNNLAVCDHSKCILCGYCCTVCSMWAIKVI